MDTFLNNSTIFQKTYWVNNALREVNSRLMDMIASLEKVVDKYISDNAPTSDDVHSHPSYIDSAPSTPQHGVNKYNV